MAVPISYLRDNFDSTALGAVWSQAEFGSATVVQTTSQLRFTLPSSTAGTHTAYVTTATTYNLTADSFYINIQTMVATGVAASAFFDLRLDASNYFRWIQTSNTLKAGKVVAGVAADLYSVTWNASTYKYLRIREAGGTVFFDSSTNGTSWTNRASVTIASTFAVTALTILIGADCGNVASPGSFRLDDVNLILPALSTNWHWTQVEWPLQNRFLNITVSAGAATAQGYIATADSTDASGNLVSPRYYSGPIGSVGGGYNALTLQASQAAAQAAAVNLPFDGRWDLPTLDECRFIRLYHRSITGSSYTLFEYYPRRLVQSDDIQAESIQAINIAAGAITADKIFVLTLGAITANIGKLNIDTTGYLYQGTGTGDAPTTGLKIFNSGGIGKLSTYNAGVEQVTLDTDGALKAGAGNVVLDAGGITIEGADSLTSRIKWSTAAAGGVFAEIVAAADAGVGNIFIRCDAGSVTDPNDSRIALNVSNYLGSTRATVTLRGTEQALWVDAGLYVGVSTPPAMSTGHAIIAGGLNMGSATGAGTGQISTSGSMAVGVGINAAARLYVKGVDNTSSNYGLIVISNAGSVVLATRNDNKIGVFGATEVGRQTVTGSRGGNAALQSLLAAMAAFGWITDSSS